MPPDKEIRGISLKVRSSMNSSATGELPRGTVLRGTYEISSVLGRGGMGTVFLAQHLRLPGKQVAIKVLRSGEELPPDVHVRFRREAEIASRLGHPNIIEVLDFDTLEDGSPFMVMEYLRGEGLSRRLRRQKRLPLEEALTFAREIGSALQAAHRAGVVHRDLKPGNVFLVPTESGGRVSERVKLLDFGISKIIDSRTVQTQEAVLIGTPQYMAPEQAMGKNREVDARTDIFSFGCIVYEMLAGRAPFLGGSLPELIYQIVHEPPDALATLAPELPGHIIEAVERAMSKRPDDRYAEVGVFIHALTGSPLQTLAPSGSVAVEPQPPPPSHVAEPRPTEGVKSWSIPAEEAPPAPGPSAPVTTPTVDARPRPRDAQHPEPAPVPDLRNKRGASKYLPLAVAVGVVLSGAAAVMLWPRPGPTPMPAPTPVAATTAPLTPPAPSKTATEPPESPAQAAPAAPTEPEEKAKAAPPRVAEASEAKVNEEARSPATSVRKGPTSRPAVAEQIPDAVRQDLAAAEKALATANTQEAIHLIRRSQRVQVTGASFALLTRAYCRQGDLGNAKAQWGRVPTAERVRVKQYCRQYDIDL